jgi:DNA-directed RNA polymerase subunit RPC12/RpoP
MPPPPPAPAAPAAPNQFPCKNCGARLEYAPGTPSLKCPYCGTENQIAVEAKPIVEHKIEELQMVAKTQATGFGTQTRSFKCKNCSATSTVPGNVQATRCPFCGSNVVFEQQANPNMVRPESVLPFQINADGATNKFRAWLKSRWLAPGALKKMAQLAKIDGVYEPFFTYDAQADSDWAGEAGHYYYVSVPRTVNQGGRNVTINQQERRIRWEHRSGHHAQFYDDVLILASTGIPERIVTKAYPFHLSAIVPYSPQFLAGFLAEEYSVDPKAGWEKAKGQVTSNEQRECSKALDGDTQRGLHVNTRLSRITWKHMLLPLYVAAYMYGAKTYRFVVNGQTGEVQGEAPISWIKVGIIAAAVAGIVVVALKLGGYF